MTRPAALAALADGPWFGRSLRAARLRAGLSQLDLAERSGLSDRAIRYLEAGACRPTALTVRCLTGALRNHSCAPSRIEALVDTIDRIHALAATEEDHG